MSSRPVIARVVLAAVLCGALIALLPGIAAAGEYAVVNCQADKVNFNTRAFEPFVTRGMRIRRACNPVGRGMRGLITTNIVGRGRVGRGAIAKLTINAPPGTHFSRFEWAGTMRRTDCRFSMNIYADAPGARPIGLKTVRANEKCPKPKLAQAAAWRSTVWEIPGATRVIQRVICMGSPKRPSCSTRGHNYVRTQEAKVEIVDDVPPAVSIVPDTPLATGAWGTAISRSTMSRTTTSA